MARNAHRGHKAADEERTQRTRDIHHLVKMKRLDTQEERPSDVLTGSSLSISLSETCPIQIRTSNWTIAFQEILRKAIQCMQCGRTFPSHQCTFTRILGILCNRVLGHAVDSRVLSQENSNSAVSIMSVRSPCGLRVSTVIEYKNHSHSQSSDQRTMMSLVMLCPAISYPVRYS